MKNLPTVTVRRGDMNVRINASDYDAERDGPLVDASEIDGGKSGNWSVGPDGAADFGPVTIGTNQPGATIGAVDALPPPDEPAQPAQPPAPPQPPAPSPEAVSDGPKAAAVVKKGRKWIVTDATGNPVTGPGIDPAGYASEKDAWDVIMKAGE